MRPRMGRLIAAGFVLAILSSSVHAQGPPGGPGGFGGPGMFGGPGGPGGPGGQNLLRAPSVQADLGLTEKQKTALQRLDATMAQRRREAFQPGEEGFDREAMMEAMNEIRADQEAAVAKILDKKQKARLTQLELQREGKLAVARKEVATKIKLTAAQTKKVKVIVDEMRTEMASAMPAPPGGGGPGGFGFAGGGGPGGPGGGGPGGPGGGGPGGAGPNGLPQDGAQPGEQNAAATAGPADGAPAGDNGGNGGPVAPGGGRGRGARGGGPGGGGPGGPSGGPPNFNNPQMQAMFAKIRETVEKVRAKATKKIDDVLTAEQKTAFDKLLGKAFDFSTIPQGPGGPGGPGGGGPGGPGGGGPAGPGNRPRNRAATDA